jgi:hypothetical protein
MPDGEAGEETTADRGHWAGITELMAVVLLSVTAVLTAWSGFEANKWGGEMSIAFSRASSARVEASRHASEANAARTFDLIIFSVYVQAAAENNRPLRDFVQTRFTEHFKVAFDAWTAMSPVHNPDAPKGPFALPEYRPPGQAESAEANARADNQFQKALQYNQRGDDYPLLTVLFALVLFFTAVSQRLTSRRLTLVVLSGALVLLLTGIGFLVSLPKIV